MKHHRWEGYIKRILYSYPSLKKAQEELRETITTAAYGVFGGRSPDPSDPVAAAALRELPPSDRRELEAVEKAICATRALGNGEQRQNREIRRPRLGTSGANLTRRSSECAGISLCRLSSGTSGSTTT